MALLNRRRQISNPRTVGRPRSSSVPRGSLQQEHTFGSVSALYGQNNLERLWGNVDDLDLTLGWDAKKQMMRDSHVSAAISTPILGAIARKGEVEPAPKNLHVSSTDAESEEQETMATETAEFCRRNLRYVTIRQRSLELTLFQIGQAAMVIGNAKAEIVLHLETDGVDKGKYTLARVKSKPRETCAFIVDKQMNVQGLAAFTGNYQDLSKFLQTRVDAMSGWVPASQLGVGWEEIEREKFLIITHKPPDNDSPEGTSALRPAYAGYQMKKNNWAFYLKALDFTALPFTWVEQSNFQGKMKPLKDDGTVDENAAPIAAASVLYKAVEIGRQGGVAILPNGTKVQAIHNAQSGDPFASAVSVFNAEITMAILLQLLATGESKHMARAAGQVHQDVLDLVMRYIRRILCEAVTRDLFGLLIKKNFPPRYWHLIPSYSLGEVELNDFTAWALAFGKLAEAGILHWSQFSSVWAVLGLPQADMDEFMAEVRHNQELVDEMGVPEVKADGTKGQSQLKKYTTQEAGKTLTRRSSRQIAGQLQSGF